MIRILYLLLAIFSGFQSAAQQPVQTIRGTVTDVATGQPLPYASLLLQPGDQHAVADGNGKFRFYGVVVGRYDITTSAVGYQPAIMKEVEVSSGKEVILPIYMEARVTQLEKIEVKPGAGLALPNMVSTNVLNVEAAQRYAGGFDDPARLVSAFAGVSSNTGNNAIMVRGNSPQALQWKMEGIEIPNPNHLGDMRAFGGGTVTALSTQLLGTSYFLSGAMPAEYGNALSGVLDISLRNGNNQRHEHTFQLGLVGMDLATEGPFRKGGKSSYLFNYRYSTLALVAPLLADNAGGIKYQDLSFKLNFPTKNAGTFSLWGTGLIDQVVSEAKRDFTLWEYDDDREEHDVKMNMGVLGLTHRTVLNAKQYWKTTFASTQRGIDYPVRRLDSSLNLSDKNALDTRYRNLVLSSFINTKFNSKWSNRTGVDITHMHYDMHIRQAGGAGDPMREIVRENGNSVFYSAYTNFKIRPTTSLRMSAGLRAQLFSLNKSYSVEPRLGVQYQLASRQSFALAYGLHSRLERLNYYFARNLQNQKINEKLNFTKAHHIVLRYELQTKPSATLKIESYYQHLFDVPVIPDSSFSLLNQMGDQFVYDKLQNTGFGRNYGLELTYDRKLSNGYYYLSNVSIFASQYRGGDGIWRDSRYNRNYSFNLLAGKEWAIGKNKQNLLGVNGRLNYQGGDHHSPVNESLSLARHAVVFDEKNAFSEQYPAALTAHLTTSYRINRNRVSHEIALKILNLTQYEEYVGFRYNYRTRQVDVNREPVVIPNLSYRIDF